MKLFLFRSGILIAALALLIGLASCSSLMVAQKNLEEGRLVPEEAVDTADFLNEYHHPLSAPRRTAAGLDIALDRKSVLAGGGRIFAQVGIATAAPTLKPLKLHVLVFAPAEPEQRELARIGSALGAIRKQASELPRGATLTVDPIAPVKGLALAEPRFLDQVEISNLKGFLTAFARRPYDEGEHHFIVLVGSYKGVLDLPGLNDRERQDLVDLGRILEAKSVTLSVLSVGKEPDFAFLAKLSEVSGGTFNVATDSLDYDAWISHDLRRRSAETLTEVELTASAGGGARLVRVLAPRKTPSTYQRVTYALPELRQGDQRVVLAELEVPARGLEGSREILSVELKYYAPNARRYYGARESVAIQYVDDPNLALPRSSAVIERSLLILDTQRTLQDVAREIRDRRNFQAIARLTRQSRALKQTGAELKDAELLRDATILASYADRLYQFDDRTFQTFKIWSDLGWDNRFRNIYR